MAEKLILAETDREAGESMSIPAGARNYFDESDDSITSIPEEKMTDTLDAEVIQANKELQAGNSSKIAQKNSTSKSAFPHDINQVNLCAWIARDSVVYKKNEISSGCKFTIALHWNGRYDASGKAYASFIDIEYRGKNAVSISPYLIKGKRVALSGRLAQYRWEQDGESHNRIVVIATDVLFFNDERNLELALE
jgi:hypothetical protein